MGVSRIKGKLMIDLKKKVRKMIGNKLDLATYPACQ